MKTALALIVFCVLAEIAAVDAQSRRRTPRVNLNVFEAGLVFGRNFAQMDGDYFTGYDKGGWYGGMRGTVNLSPITSLHVEMLFSQQGSRIPHGTVVTSESVNDRLIATNYATVPLLAKFNFDRKPSSLYVEIGGSYSRLFDTQIEESKTRFASGTIYEDIVPEFSNSDFNVVAGFGYAAENRVDIGIRFTQALTNMYDNNDYDPGGFGELKEVKFLRNYYISLLVAVRFI